MSEPLNHAFKIVVQAPATVAWPAPYAGCVGFFHLPDHVERVLQLHDDANGGKEKRADPQEGSEDACSRAVGSRQHRFDGFRSGFAEHLRDRRHDLRGDRIAAEEEPGHSDDDDDDDDWAK